MEKYNLKMTPRMNQNYREFINMIYILEILIYIQIKVLLILITEAWEVLTGLVL